jgi:glutamate formiminotransferase/formiminotetrahydrofolate cyclodeaminase
LTVGKRKYADVEGEMWAMVEEATSLNEIMQQAVSEDSEAFESYMTARRLPRDTEQQKSDRIQAIRTASINAAKVPLHVAGQALEIMTLAEKAAKIGNVNAISDAGTASALAQAAITGAGLNVRINLLGLEKENGPAQMLNELRRIDKQAAKLKQSIQGILTERGGLDLT